VTRMSGSSCSRTERSNCRAPGRKRSEPVTLAELFAGYRDNYPLGAKEQNTRYTERIHMRISNG